MVRSNETMRVIYIFQHLSLQYILDANDGDSEPKKEKKGEEPPVQSTSDGTAASDVGSRSDGAFGNGGGGGDGGDDDPPEERSSKKRSAHQMDVQDDDEDDDEDEEEEEDGPRVNKRPPTGLLKVSQALQGLGYIYEKDLNARHAETPSARAGAVYWK